MEDLLKNKFILDACCGGKCFWFNKNHPNTLYIDIRKREKGHSKDRKNHSVKPDIMMDFRALKFKDKTFNLVVWDPPHMFDLTESSIMCRKYGTLKTETYAYDLNKGFKECWRVLKDNGVLIFKWNETSKSLNDILKLFPEKPLFGHPTNSKNTTHWMCFMKIPEIK